MVTGKALADVVQQRTDQEEVGSFDRVGELGGQRGGLQQVTIHGEAVVSVALRLVAHGGPLGEEADEEAVLIE